MNLSGIIVTTEPAAVQRVLDRLALLPGIEVDRFDAERGRIVLIQEAENVAAEVESFARIRALPEVLAVDLATHVFADPEELP